MDVITGLSPLSKYGFLEEKGQLIGIQCTRLRSMTIHWNPKNLHTMFYGFRVLTKTFYCFFSTSLFFFLTLL